ncbi:hypothetical protein LCGC14_0854820 [marine sediment metagenome]|uniref:Uncharacterized protein n=1 Tax=marine sediment metagenome TaxID=412755 RepID=A0A0F9RTQ3_9ZZZZ
MVMKIINGNERYFPPYDENDVSTFHIKGGLFQLMDENVFWVTEECKKRINAVILSEINKDENIWRKE